MSNGLLTPEQRRQAMSMGLLSAGAGLLSGAYNPGGRFGPAAAQGLAGFGGAMQQAQAAAIQQRELEQQERFRTAQMQDLLIKRQMEQQKIIEEQKRRQTLQQTLERILGGQRTQAQPMPQGAPTAMPMPQSGFAGAALATQLDPSVTPPVNAIAPPEIDPQALTMAGLTMAAQDPQTANVLLSGATNIRKTQENERAEERQKQLDRLADWEDVTGVPGVEKKKSEGKYYWNRSVEVPAEEVFKLAKERAQAGAMQAKIENFIPAAEEVQKEQAKELIGNYKLLRNTAATLKNMERARELVQSAGGFVGSLAEKKLAVVKFFNNNFGTSIKANEVADAETLRTTLFQQIMDNLKKLDAQPSQLQQQIMMEAMGNITTDPKAIPQILDTYEEILRSKVEQHNVDAEEAKKTIKFLTDPVIKLPPRRVDPNDPLGIR